MVNEESNLISLNKHALLFLDESFWRIANTMSKETPVSEEKFLTLGKIDAWSLENDNRLNLCP